LDKQRVLLAAYESHLSSWRAAVTVEHKKRWNNLLSRLLGATVVIGALLVGVSPTDPITFGSVALVLTLAAVAGCAVPARRATRVDPAVALRHQ